MSEPLSNVPDPAGDVAADSRYATNWFLVVLPVAIVAACAELGTAILNNSTLPLFYHLGLGISLKVYPILMIPFFISEAVFKLPLGVLSDKYGRKPLMLGGALVTIFTPIALTLIHRTHYSVELSIMLGLGLLRLFDGLGGAALWPALYSYIGDVVAESKRGAALGLLNVVYMAGLALAFLAGGFADDMFGPVFTGDSSFGKQFNVVGQKLRTAGHAAMHRVALAGHHVFHHAAHHLTQPHPHPPLPIATANHPVVDPLAAQLSRPEHYFPSFYLVSFLFGLCAIIIALTMRNPRKSAFGPGSKHAEEHSPAMSWADYLTALKRVPQFMVLAFVAFVGIGCIAPLFKLFVVAQFHITEKAVGILMLKPTLLIAAIALPVGILSDRWGKTRSVRLGFVLCSIGLWAIPVVHHYSSAEIGFVIAATLVGVGSVFAFPAWTALLTTLCTDSQRGTIVGAVSTAQGIGILIGFILGPWLAATLGRMAPFIAAASFVTVATLLSLVYVRECALKRPPAQGLV